MGGCLSSSPSTPAPGQQRPDASGSVDKRLKEADVNGPDKGNRFSKTKGGSLIFNVTERSMMGEEKIDFVDEQNITSPSKADWKVGKAIKRAPEMKETVVIPVAIPEAQGGGFIKTEVGYKTLQGKNPRPPHKPNQDALSIFIVEGHPNLVVFACFE